MIAYDQLVDGLSERVGELALRLRDLVLSLGAGVKDQMKGKSLEFEAGGRFARITPDNLGVTLTLFGPLGSPLDDWGGRLTPQGKGAALRLSSTADVDEPLRRILKDAYARAVAGSGSRKPLQNLELPADMLEGLQNLSRGLRLWMHTLQVMQKVEKQRELSAARAGQKRSHKKKPPAVPPPLALAVAVAPVMAVPKVKRAVVKKKPAPVKKKAPVRKAAPKKKVSRKR